MDKLGDFFDSFYSRFVLRDFFGKIGPGFILLFAVGLWLESPNQLLTRLADPSLEIWLSLLPIAWLAGFALQSFGELEWPGLGKLIWYDPGEPNIKWAGLRLRYREHIRTGDYPEDARQIERLVVIKEACGNGYVALLFGLGMLVMKIGHENEVASTALSLLPILLVLVLFTVLLRRMHCEHVIRQYKYTRGFLVLRDKAAEEDYPEQEWTYPGFLPFVGFMFLFFVVSGILGLVIGLLN
jgi:hypothetical protein